MKFDDYYRGLTRVDREAFAKRAKTTTRYIEIHLLAPDRSRRKVPRKPLMEALAEASQGQCTLEEVVSHFFELAA